MKEPKSLVGRHPDHPLLRGGGVSPEGVTEVYRSHEDYCDD